MAKKQYGLKVVYEPSNTVEREEWFNTESERNSAMAGSTLDPHYMFVAAERKLRSRWMPSRQNRMIRRDEHRGGSLWRRRLIRFILRVCGRVRAGTAALQFLPLLLGEHQPQLQTQLRQRAC